MAKKSSSRKKVGTSAKKKKRGKKAAKKTRRSKPAKKKTSATRSTKATESSKSSKPGTRKKTAKKKRKSRARKRKPAKGKLSKPKTPLTKKQLAQFREMLLEKRRDLLGDLTGIEAGSIGRNRQDGTGDLSNMPTHPADIGSDNYEQEFSLSLLESERLMLAEINEALDRIDEGAYGLCLGTGQPIGLPRLTARPWARYCIEYARLIEKGLVRRGDGELEQDEDEDEDEEDLEQDESAEDEDEDEELEDEE